MKNLKEIAQAAIASGALTPPPATVDSVGPERLSRICGIVGIELPYTLTGVCGQMLQEVFNVLEAYCLRDRPTSKGFVIELVKFMAKIGNHKEEWMRVIALEQTRRALRAFGCPRKVDVKDHGVFVTFWSQLNKAIQGALKGSASKHRKGGPSPKPSRFKATPIARALGRVHHKPRPRR